MLFHSAICALRLPPVLLEDLLCIVPHVFAGRGEFGCSIDPNRERLVRAYQFANTSNSQRALQRNARTQRACNTIAVTHLGIEAEDAIHQTPATSMISLFESGRETFVAPRGIASRKRYNQRTFGDFSVLSLFPVER